MMGNDYKYECCCAEFKLDSRAYLAAWMCFKNDAHLALGDFGEIVRASLSKQIPSQQARMREEAAEAWAHQVVLSTADALRVRRACESLGAALWRAGADVVEPLQPFLMTQGASEGLLASSIDVARADEEDEYADQDMFAVEFDYDDIVGYVEDYTGARALRHAAHGAPRRICKEKMWVAGKKVRATAPSHAKKQKRALVAGARCSIADARRLRMLRRAHQSNQDV